MVLPHGHHRVGVQSGTTLSNVGERLNEGFEGRPASVVPTPCLISIIDVRLEVSMFHCELDVLLLCLRHY